MGVICQGEQVGEEEEEVFFGSITIKELGRAINLHDNSTFVVDYNMPMARHQSCVTINENQIACASVRAHINLDVFTSMIFMILHLRRGLRRRRLKKQKIIEDSIRCIIRSFRSYRFRKTWASCIVRVHEISMMLTRFQACARGLLTRRRMIRLSNLSLGLIEQKDYNETKNFFADFSLVDQISSKIPKSQSVVMPITHEPCFSAAFSGPADDETHRKIIMRTLCSSEDRLTMPSEKFSSEPIFSPLTKTRPQLVGERMKRLRKKEEHLSREKERLRLTEINTLLNKGYRRNLDTRIVKADYISRSQPEMKYRGYNGDDSIYDRHEPGSGHVYWKELLIETNDVKHSPHHKTTVPRRSCMKVNCSFLYEHLPMGSSNHSFLSISCRRCPLSILILLQKSPPFLLKNLHFYAELAHPFQKKLQGERVQGV